MIREEETLRQEKLEGIRGKCLFTMESGKPSSKKTGYYAGEVVTLLLTSVDGKSRGEVIKVNESPVRCSC